MSADDFIVTPWHVEGKIDYDKLIKQFGTEKITNDLLNQVIKLAGEDHFMLRRGVFFSHRDLKTILDEYEKGNKFFLYTGRGPSGHTHIGHLVPWVFAKWLQDKFNVNMYFQLTDDEKFYSKQNLSLEETKKFAYENALDFIALGFKPENTKIIIDTENIQTLYPIAAQVAKKINFSNTKAVFGFTNDTNIGMIFYTALQSAPCFIEDKPVLIPLGVDQDPHFRLTRDVAPKIGKLKPALIHNIMIPSLQGPGGKMSASEENTTIYTTDSPDVVKMKINKYAFSGGKPDVEQHRKEGGNPDIDVS
ncbi:MAG: tryptophan--tRNA ligase, partial [Thaumarchaeota archaeon]|nr:tryptophan--tRNA ligase [Nitrososphaerota archaeon]